MRKMKSYKETKKNYDSQKQAGWYSPVAITECFREADRRIEHWFDQLISEIEGLHQIHSGENQEAK
jgi:hypothetical protein